MMTGPFKIRTPRLELIAGNHQMAAAEMTSIMQLANLLNAGFDYGWPPPENNEKTMEWFFNRILDNPDERGWLIWYFIHTENGNRVVVGNGGFSGAPDENGIVECGFSILEPAQKQGFATEAVGGLVKWAFSNPMLRKITARARPGNLASKSVLEKNQFQPVNNGQGKNKRITYEIHCKW